MRRNRERLLQQWLRLSHLSGVLIRRYQQIEIVVLERRRAERVEVVIGNRLVDSPMSERKVEPQLVFHDGTADTGVEIPNLLDDAHVREDVSWVVRQIAPQVASKIRALPRTMSEVAERCSVECVAAVRRSPER